MDVFPVNWDSVHEVMNKEQFFRICHISKSTALHLLKSGKVREKISISLLRDGVDCGSFGKFSAGEAARVNLATILAMQKLVNANCDDEKGLDLLVLDEILEAVDYVCWTRRQEHKPHTPSSIIKLTKDGRVTIIRK